MMRPRHDKQDSSLEAVSNHLREDPSKIIDRAVFALHCVRHGGYEEQKDVRLEFRQDVMKQEARAEMKEELAGTREYMGYIQLEHITNNPSRKPHARANFTVRRNKSRRVDFGRMLIDLAHFIAELLLQFRIRSSDE